MIMTKKITKYFLLLFVLMVSANLLNAQPTSSLLSGKVLDEKNLPVKGVIVQITYVPWNKTRDGQTDKKGFFCIGNLPPGGPYSIKFTCEGYEAQTREVSNLDLGNVNDLSLHMRLENKGNKASETIASNKEAKVNTTTASNTETAIRIAE
jgi:Carboxypeptidase regulatory-like domain